MVDEQQSGTIPHLDPHLIRKIDDGLKEVIEQLESLAQDCLKKSRRKRQERVGTFRWIWNKRKVAQLRDKARSVRDNIQIALLIAMTHHQV